MSPSRLDSQDTRAGVSGEQVASVPGEPCLVAERFLHYEIEPVIGQSRAQLLVLVPGGEFDVQAAAESRGEWPGRVSEVPLDSHVCIAEAAGSGRSRSAVDGKIRDIEIQFQTVGETKVDLEIGRVLAEVWVLERLEGVVLVVELKVQGSPVGHVGIVS